MAFTYLAVRVGQGLRNAAGQPTRGWVRFTPTAPDGMRNGTTVVHLPVTLVVADDGTLPEPIAATDDPGTAPAGSAYLVEIGAYGAPTRRFYAAFPHATAGGVVDLDEVDQLAASPALVSASGTIRGADDYDDTTAPEVGQAIVWTGDAYAPGDVAGGSGGGVSTPDATTSVKGKARILGGTADAPTVPYTSVTGRPTLAAVATSGSAADITAGVLPDAQIPSGIARDSEVTSAVAAHAAASDPHGDRAAAATGLAAHEADTTSVHGISDTSALETATGSAAKVAAHTVASDPHGDRAAAASALTAHAAVTTSVHGIANTAALETTTGSAAKVAAHAVASDPHGDRAAAATALAAHEADTTAVHGIANTAALATTAAVAAGYQPLDADLTAVAALDNGNPVRTAGTWSVRSDAALATALGVSGGGGAPTIDPRPVIFDTDWWSDVDDAVAARILCHAERIGLVDIIAAVLSTSYAKGPGSLDAFLTAEGHPGVPIGVAANTVTGSAAYQDLLFDTYPHIEGYPTTTATSTSIYRRALAAADAASVDIISVGGFTALSALLQSSADGISGLSGLALVTAKVRHLWVMGGQWPVGSESNFSGDSAATSYVLTNWPSAVPATFLGYEVGASVITGGNLSALSTVDHLAAVLGAAGYGSGRSSWDPMLTWLACLDNPTVAGYTTVTGTATPSGWTPGAGPHQYVVKTRGDHHYQREINARLLPGINPPAPTATAGEAVAAVLRTPAAATFTRPSRATGTTTNLIAQWHADDLDDLAGSATVSHWDDRLLATPARQLASGSRPTVTTIGSRRCVSFAAGSKWLASDPITLPDTMTVYALVRWASLPGATQTIVGGDAASVKAFRVGAASGGAVQASGYNVGAATTDSAGTATANTWQVIAAKVTPSAVETYLEGTSTGGAATPSGQNSGPARIAIGSRLFDSVDQGFSGYVREIRLYAAAHSSGTITTITSEMQDVAPDVTAPTVPAGLTATPGDTQVDLAWSASTDAVGVDHYVVRRDGSSIATPAGTTYTDTGRTNGVSYSYTVAAVDAAGNASAQSGAQSATPAASAFVPTSITGLALWLDASDATKRFTDTAGTAAATLEGALIARLSDKSGNSRHATQGTSGSRPVLNLAAQNGKAVAYFDGTDDALSVALNPSTVLTEGATVYVVAKMDDTDARSWSWLYGDSGGGASGFFLGKSGFTDGVHYAATSWHNGTDSPTGSIAGAYHVFGQQESDTVSRVILDGTLATDTTWTNAAMVPGTFNVGARGTSEPWKGPIAELLIWTRVLDGTERGQVEDYLSAKWATP